MPVTFFLRSIYRAKKFEHCEGRRSLSESSAVNKLSSEKEPGRQQSFCRLITLNPPISNLSSVNINAFHRGQTIMQLLIGKVKYYQPFIMTISQRFKLGSLETRSFYIEDELLAVIYLVSGSMSCQLFTLRGTPSLNSEFRGLFGVGLLIGIIKI